MGDKESHTNYDSLIVELRSDLIAMEATVRYWRNRCLGAEAELHKLKKSGKMEP